MGNKLPQINNIKQEYDYFHNWKRDHRERWRANRHTSFICSIYNNKIEQNEKKTVNIMKYFISIPRAKIKRKRYDSYWRWVRRKTHIQINDTQNNFVSKRNRSHKLCFTPNSYLNTQECTILTMKPIEASVMWHIISNRCLRWSVDNKPIDSKDIPGETAERAALWSNSLINCSISN